MIFEVGKAYKHVLGYKILIIGEVDTYHYGKCLVGENNIGELKPVGKEEYNTIGFKEISIEEFKND